MYAALQGNETIGARGASALAASAVWIGVSSWAARLASSNTVKSVAQKYWKQLLLKLGPPLFLAGLLILCGFGAALSVLWVGGPDALWTGSEVWWLLAGSLAIFAISGVVLDSNEFSLHGFYRDRIVRSYLGASNADSPAADSRSAPVAICLAGLRAKGIEVDLVVDWTPSAPASPASQKSHAA